MTGRAHQRAEEETSKLRAECAEDIVRWSGLSKNQEARGKWCQQTIKFKSACDEKNKEDKMLWKQQGKLLEVLSREKVVKQNRVARGRVPKVWKITRTRIGGGGVRKKSDKQSVNLNKGKKFWEVSPSQTLNLVERRPRDVVPRLTRILGPPVENINRVQHLPTVIIDNSARTVVSHDSPLKSAWKQAELHTKAADKLKLSKQEIHRRTEERGKKALKRIRRERRKQNLAKEGKDNFSREQNRRLWDSTSCGRVHPLPPRIPDTIPEHVTFISSLEPTPAKAHVANDTIKKSSPHVFYISSPASEELSTVREKHSIEPCVSSLSIPPELGLDYRTVAFSFVPDEQQLGTSNDPTSVSQSMSGFERNVISQLTVASQFLQTNIFPEVPKNKPSQLKVSPDTSESCRDNKHEAMSTLETLSGSKGQSYLSTSTPNRWKTHEMSSQVVTEKTLADMQQITNRLDQFLKQVRFPQNEIFKRGFDAERSASKPNEDRLQSFSQVMPQRSSSAVIQNPNGFLNTTNFVKKADLLASPEADIERVLADKAAKLFDDMSDSTATNCMDYKLFEDRQSPENFQVRQQQQREKRELQEAVAELRRCREALRQAHHLSPSPSLENSFAPPNWKTEHEFEDNWKPESNSISNGQIFEQCDTSTKDELKNVKNNGSVIANLPQPKQVSRQMGGTSISKDFHRCNEPISSNQRILYESKTATSNNENVFDQNDALYNNNLNNTKLTPAKKDNHFLYQIGFNDKHHTIANQMAQSTDSHEVTSHSHNLTANLSRQSPNLVDEKPTLDNLLLEEAHKGSSTQSSSKPISTSTLAPENVDIDSLFKDEKVTFDATNNIPIEEEMNSMLLDFKLQTLEGGETGDSISWGFTKDGVNSVDHSYIRQTDDWIICSSKQTRQTPLPEVLDKDLEKWTQKMQAFLNQDDFREFYSDKSEQSEDFLSSIKYRDHQPMPIPLESPSADISHLNPSPFGDANPFSLTAPTVLTDYSADYREQLISAQATLRIVMTVTFQKLMDITQFMLTPVLDNIILFANLPFYVSETPINRTYIKVLKTASEVTAICLEIEFTSSNRVNEVFKALGENVYQKKGTVVYQGRILDADKSFSEERVPISEQSLVLEVFPSCL